MVKRFNKIAVLFIILSSIIFILNAQTQPELFTPMDQFTIDSHVIYTSFFHWYSANAGQKTGPWIPLGGRETWTGTTSFWKGQIKQVMAANIDIMLVHLIPSWENQRITLFKALYEMRQEGYNVPKVAPFLDPIITWNNKANVDLGTEDGKDELVSHYIRFFNQYFDNNPDEYAVHYLAKFDGRIILDSWHPHLNLDNINSFTRSDLETRLQTAFADEYPVFNNGIYQITTVHSPQNYTFADEKVIQFEVHSYFEPNIFNNIKTVQIKPGYWDQNVRTPGYFMARKGGFYYKNMWTHVDHTYDRIYIESFNEYDEGSGIYAGETGDPYCIATNTNSDQWSTTNNPMEYIKTTAINAAKFNDFQDYDSRILWHNIPDKMKTNEIITSQILVRNEGNVSWNNRCDVKMVFSFMQDSDQISSYIYKIDDSQDEIDFYGGVFRGRPMIFDVEFQAPVNIGNYTLTCVMQNEDGTTFGDSLKIDVIVENSSKIDQNHPTQFELHQNYPNPFNPSTNIKYSIEDDANVTLSIYNTQGQFIKTLVQRSQSSGNYEVSWDGSNNLSVKLPSGIYICKLNALSQKKEFNKTQKMILMK